MASQQTENIIRRVEEEARLLRALATENEENKNLIKHLQDRLKDAKEREEEMRKEIALLRHRDISCNIVHIHVKTLSGNQHPFRMKSCDVTHEIKLKIQEKEYCPPDMQTLIFRGKTLEDGKTLAESGIVSGSTVYLVLRLGGRRESD